MGYFWSFAGEESREIMRRGRKQWIDLESMKGRERERESIELVRC
jgi:hypothetical protein